MLASAGGIVTNTNTVLGRSHTGLSLDPLFGVTPNMCFYYEPTSSAGNLINRKPHQQDTQHVIPPADPGVMDQMARLLE